VSTFPIWVKELGTKAEGMTQVNSREVTGELNCDIALEDQSCCVSSLSI
jgi:hypothetical protein